MTSPPGGVQRDFPLARLTTVRTGGAAVHAFFAASADDAPAAPVATTQRATPTALHLELRLQDAREVA